MRIDENIEKSMFACLFTYYAYPDNCINNKISADNKEKLSIAKRVYLYEVCRGIFYKSVFKSIENEKINIIYYCKNKSKMVQFQNMIQENDFKDLFTSYIKELRMSKDDLEIIFYNSSHIKFKTVSDNARGCRYHFAVVDTDVDNEILHNVILPSGILFEISKNNGALKDNYNVQFIEM
jgi:hypothetical protein